MAAGDRISRQRCAGLLGSPRLSQPRRSLGRTALFRRLDACHLSIGKSDDQHHGDIHANGKIPVRRRRRPSACRRARPARRARRSPMHCSRIASPAARTCWRPGGSRSRWRPRASPRCASISPGSAPAKAISPTRPSPPTSPISCAPPIICAQPASAAILIGHSLGGAAILAAAARDSGRQGRRHHRGTVRSRACHRPVHGSCRETSASTARSRSRWPAGPFTIKREFLDDIAEHESDGASRTICTRRCWSCIRRPTTPSASTMRPVSS